MKPCTRRTITVALISSLGAITFPNLRAQESHLLLDLRGEWRFELGDDPRWSGQEFDDSRWSEISVPSTWEDQGYPGYDGYAWYRKHFSVSKEWLTEDLVLDLGMIDDVDEAYLNGQSIGTTGLFPPHYMTAYNLGRRYPVPEKLLRADTDNVIAIRVFDQELGGGIVRGRVGLYERRDLIRPDVELPLVWKFRTGDEDGWKEPGLDDKKWKNVNVPAQWETQGFRDYDGYAWYRVAFKVSDQLRNENLVLLLGKIDDFDETFLNGKRIGRTGTMPSTELHYTNSDSYRQLRAYTIPPDLLRREGENILAVRVYDCWLGGGIYDGPIGILTREHYLAYQHRIGHRGDWIKELIDEIFH